MEQSPYEFGDLLRTWRERRNVSQLALASQADVSARHLSFVENGRSSPSRAMVLRLGEHLQVPLRDQNRMLLAAGFAPAFTETSLESPELSRAMDAVRQVLVRHEPNPAFIVDRARNIVEMNAAVAPLFFDGVDADMLVEPINAFRIVLHPQGLAPRVRNLPELRHHLLWHLERNLRQTADPGLLELYQELLTYPSPGEFTGDGASVVAPILFEHRGTVLSLFSTVMTFGTPRDVTLEELALESFYPSDDATAVYLREIVQPPA